MKQAQGELSANYDSDKTLLHDKRFQRDKATNAIARVCIRKSARPNLGYFLKNRSKYG